MASITLATDTHTVTLTEHKSELTARERSALSGWYNTPDAKVESTQRQAGHGAHDITDDMVLYASRTVRIDLVALAETRAGVLAIIDSVQRLAGHVVTLTVDDGEQVTQATGYITTSYDADRYETYTTGRITVVCQDPRRYAVPAAQYLLAPASGTDGGLVFDLTTGNLETDPVTFYGDSQGGNVCVLTNAGTTTAHPVITIEGYWPYGVTLNTSAGALTYGAGVYHQTVIIDTLTRTASINGVDVTRNLTRRNFPTVEPGGNIRVACMSAGTGSVTITAPDTYI